MLKPDLHLPYREWPCPQPSHWNLYPTPAPLHTSPSPLTPGSLIEPQIKETHLSFILLPADVEVKLFSLLNPDAAVLASVCVGQWALSSVTTGDCCYIFSFFNPWVSGEWVVFSWIITMDSLDPTPDLLNKVSVVQRGPMRFTFLKKICLRQQRKYVTGWCQVPLSNAINSCLWVGFLRSSQWWCCCPLYQATHKKWD